MLLPVRRERRTGWAAGCARGGATKSDDRIAEGVEDGFRHGRNRGLMKNEIDTGACFMHGVEIDDVGFSEVDAIENIVEIFAFPGGEVIDAAHLVAAGKDGACQGRSDEAANASNQVESHASSS